MRRDAKLRDATLIQLLAARRAAEHQVEPMQTETSRKLVIVPQHVWDGLMAATQAVLIEEIEG
jgi:hypothetical protein